MMPHFHRVAIVGLGLIGGSLGMALRRKRLATTVVGLSRKRATLRRAKARGAIDVGTTRASEALRGADLVILAAPVGDIIERGVRIARWMPPGSILTDVGSTKAQIVKTFERHLPDHISFVGGHPLAGSERRGIDAAQLGLFDGALCVMTPTRHTSHRSLQQVGALWRALGARVIQLDPEQHDRILGRTSHLPHALAYCLALAADSKPLPQPPPSLLDMTRIAQSDPDVWDDIFFTNRVALRAAMDRFERHWRQLRTLLRRADRRALRHFLARAQFKRHALDPH